MENDNKKFNVLLKETDSQLIAAIQNYMNAGHDSEELLEIAKGEAEWWAEEREAIRLARGE